MTSSPASTASCPDDEAVVPALEVADAVDSARNAGLRYITDAAPGIRRERVGNEFRYIDQHGRPIQDPAHLQRIKKLAIPPAWTDVWIAPTARGHIQATGRDAKGRKQYRYHPRWRQVRDETKYGRMVAFGNALPLIRRQVNADLARHGLSYEKVLAAVVALLDTTHIRIGNEEYARQNASYGLTTLRNEHVDVVGSQIKFQFRGKSGKDHSIAVRNRRLARILQRCQDLPGHELFQYPDDEGQLHSISSDDVNEYLRMITGQPFTAKDFRTWAGTVIAAQSLQTSGAFETQTQAKANIAHAVAQAAEHLGNTTTICRKCYVHPSIVDAYLDGSLLQGPALPPPPRAPEEDVATGLRPEEASVLTILQQEVQHHAINSGAA